MDVYTYYASNKGNPVMSAVGIMKDIYSKMPEDCYIAHSCVTGYGENIIRAALNVDIGEIETMKAQHEGALPPPCIVRKDPRVPHTARRGA